MKFIFFAQDSQILIGVFTAVFSFYHLFTVDGLDGRQLIHPAVTEASVSHPLAICFDFKIIFRVGLNLSLTMKGAKTAAFIGYICKLLRRPYLPYYLVVQVIGRYLRFLKRKDIDFRVHLGKELKSVNNDGMW